MEEATTRQNIKQAISLSFHFFLLSSQQFPKILSKLSHLGLTQTFWASG
jgi:hypothetical protein